jgi:hypothetical protein
VPSSSSYVIATNVSRHCNPGMGRETQATYKHYILMVPGYACCILCSLYVLRSIWRSSPVGYTFERFHVVALCTQHTPCLKTDFTILTPFIVCLHHTNLVRTDNIPCEAVYFTSVSADLRSFTPQQHGSVFGHSYCSVVGSSILLHRSIFRNIYLHTQSKSL